MLRQSVLRQVPGRLAVPLPARQCVQRRTFLSRPKPSGRAVNNLDHRQLSQKAAEYHRKRQIFLWSGAIAGIVSFIYTAYKLKLELEKKPHQCDSGLPPTDPLAANNTNTDRKVVLHDQNGREIVPTGNSTVPEFPRTLELPAYTAPVTAATADPLAPNMTLASTEYTLVGLGTRTVTFVGIQVYVVGYYVATADIAALQEALVKKVNPIATTLVPGERDKLRADLLDPAASEQTWNELLASGIPARSVFRVVPVRDTDFHHLRDGFVRAIQARVPAETAKGGDEAFGEAMRQFRGVFNRGSVPKKKELLLIRDEHGKLSIVYEDVGNKKEGRPAGRHLIGVVDDERVSRGLWLNYLGGKKVASEPARQSIVNGLMEFVERPVGTVASQVVSVGAP